MDLEFNITVLNSIASLQQLQFPLGNFDDRIHFQRGKRHHAIDSIEELGANMFLDLADEVLLIIRCLV